MRALPLSIFALLLVGCPSPRAAPPPPPPTIDAAPPPPEACGGPKLRVHFYDVGQGLSALVELPDGRNVLVDAGESPKRPGCGAPCEQAHLHLLDALANDLAGKPIDLLWITHQHSDHLGGVPELLGVVPVSLYVDNGHDLDKGGPKRARAAVASRGVTIQVVGPGAAAAPLASSASVRITPIVPSAWPSACAADENACSIALRIDYCKSSMLFVGDAPAVEEKALDPKGAVTLLQVGHHGSETSSSEAFLARVAPKYAVVSAAKPGVGMNRVYCHPRRSAIERVSAALSGARTATLRVFDGLAPCKDAGEEHWADLPVPATLWSTSRDGDVVLVTTGDGTFARQ